LEDARCDEVFHSMGRYGCVGEADAHDDAESGTCWAFVSVWGLVRLGADDEVASCAGEPSACAHAARSDGVSIWAMAGVQDGRAEGSTCGCTLTSAVLGNKLAQMACRNCTSTEHSFGSFISVFATRAFS